jgi:hypothetical protein
MYFSGTDSSRILVRTPTEYVAVYNSAIIQYSGIYLGKPVLCIGEVVCPKITDSEVCGIYVMPHKIYTDAWYHFKLMCKRLHKYPVYPELLYREDQFNTIVWNPSEVECVGTIEFTP